MIESRIPLSAIALIALSISGAGGQQTGAIPGVRTWTVQAQPVVEIGDEANTQTQFNGVSGVLRLPSGEIVVANARSQELRVFSPKGVYLRTIGRDGDGPGEFRSLAQISSHGDTIFAFDYGPSVAAGHLSAFTPSAFRSRVALRAANAPTGLTPIGRLASGAIVVYEGSMHVIPRLPAGSLWTDTLRIGLLTPGDPGTVSWIGRFPSHQVLMFAAPAQRVGRGAARPGGSAAPVPYSFGRYLGQAVVGDRIWLGDSETGEVSVFGATGAKVLSFRLPLQPRAFNTATIARLKAAAPAAAASPFARARIEALYAAPLPKSAPLFTRFVSGADGEVWVELYDEDPDAPKSFLIIDRSGKGIGRATLPASVTLFGPGRDYILGVRKDDDGVEHIVQYAVKR